MHYLQKFNEHNHTPTASSAEVAKNIAIMRNRAQGTNDPPAQIIQDTIINVPTEVYPYIPSHNALQEEFLIRDSIIEEERILLFTTKVNIQHLSKALYWMMDGTFKTVLTIF
ncbi:5324_t:CDS:2, partial [Cetraspora pellucida]